MSIQLVDAVDTMLNAGQSVLPQQYGGSYIGAATYAQLRAYTGDATRIQIGGRNNYFDGASGIAVRTGNKPDNDGTVWVDALGRSWERQYSGAVNVRWFGAVGKQLGDDTAPFNAAVLACALAGGGRVVAPFDTYKILGKVLLPSNVELDLCGSTLLGSGLGFAGSGLTVTGTGTMFETGYLDGGVIVTNIGTPNESHLITGLRVYGGTIKNVGTAFNLFNFNWQSALREIQFENVGVPVKAKCSWYGKFHLLTSLFDAGGTTEAAFQFSDFVNVENLTSLFCTGRHLAYKFSGGISGLLLSTLSAEGCTNGMLFEGEINPLNIDSCYFEDIAGTAIDMTHASAKRAVKIDNCWFYTVGTGIAGTEMTGGEIGDGNHFNNVTTKVSIADNASTIRVRIPQRFIADNTTLTPASAASIGYNIGPNIDLSWRSTVFSNATGRAIISTQSTGQPVDLPYYGYVDYIPGKVPFCTVTPYSGGVDIDTNIFPSFVASGPVILRITDGDGVKNFFGQFYGTNVAMASSVPGATVTAYNSSGKLRINVSGLNGTPSVIEGIIRLA